MENFVFFGVGTVLFIFFVMGMEGVESLFFGLKTWYL